MFDIGSHAPPETREHIQKLVGRCEVSRETGRDVFDSPFDPAAFEIG